MASQASESVPMTKAYVSPKPGFELELKEVPLPPMGPLDVKVKIECCGVCASDKSLVLDEWGFTQGAPIVAGHEGIGRVVAKGELVKFHEIGDLVGVGWMRSSCGGCLHCKRANENFCPEFWSGSIGTYLAMNGAFAEECVLDAKFACKIPEDLDPLVAAPLMCAGITVYGPLADNVTHMSKVGVNAVGGLGHLAIQFAAKMGCEVTAMNRGTKKKDVALGFGAHKYIDTTNEEEMKAAAGTLDFLLDTAPATPDQSKFLPLLGAAGKYNAVGVPHDGKKMEFSVLDLLGASKSVAGTGYSNLARMNDMMMFASRHKIVADTQVMEFGQIEEALKMVAEGTQEKLRIVLKR